MIPTLAKSSRMLETFPRIRGGDPDPAVLWPAAVSLFLAYAGVFLIPAERRRSCGTVVHPSIGRPGGPELIHNRRYAYIPVNANKS